jgi:predicted alpha/beta-hydrolase family hydrolase
MLVAQESAYCRPCVASAFRRKILAVKLTTYSSASPKAALVLAHGAGAGQKSPFMVRFARGMAQREITTATFDFPYMTAGRKVPDRAPVLEAAWRDALDAARREFNGLKIVIGGKSMGGRIASHIASQGVEGVDGLVFLGYPLHPPGKPEQRRDAHLPAIKERMLFVQGTRDAFGTADEIRPLLPSLQHAELHEVAGGDHSFKVPGGRTADPLEAIMDIVSAWVASPD